MADPNQPNPTPTPGIFDHLTSIIGNPLVQGALGAYFNAISAPRHTSTAGRLGIGGLGGLEAFDAAQKQRSQQPLQDAATQLAQARVPLAQAQMAEAQAKTAQMAGNPEANKAVAAQMQLQLQGTTDPTQRQILQMLIPGVANGVTKPEKVAELLQKGDVNSAAIERDNAQTALAKANTGLVGPRAAEIAAHTAELGTASEKNVAEAGKAERPPAPKATAGSKGAVSGKPPSELALEKQADSEAEKSWAAAGTMAHMTGNHDDYVAQFKSKWLAEHGSGGGSAEPEIPAGAKPVYDAGGTLIGFKHD